MTGVATRPAIRRLAGAKSEGLRKKGYRYSAVIEFPSGRTIRKQKPERNKKGAFMALRTVARVQTSPTAGGASYNPDGGRQTWQQQRQGEFAKPY